MATLCRFVLPTSLSSVEEACVAEFNEYKKRMKEISQQKSANKRLTNPIGGIAGTSAGGHDSISQQKTTPRNPEQAREEAKKLVQSGLIKVTAQGKDQGFKRASSSTNNADRGNKKLAVTPNTSSPSIGMQSNPFQPVSFVGSSNSSSTSRPGPTNVQENKRRVVNYDDTDNY